MKKYLNRASQKPTSPQSCIPVHHYAKQQLQKTQIYQQMKCKLEQILCSLLYQKQQYQKDIQLTFSNLKSEYLSNLEQKDLLISQLQNTIKTLNEKSKELQQQYSSKLEKKEQEIAMLRLILKKKYLQQLNLQENIKRYQKKQKTQQLIRMSYQNIESLISLKLIQEPPKSINKSAFNKKSFQKDTQKTGETMLNHQNDSIPTVIKKRHKKTSSILNNNDLKKDLSQNYMSTNLAKSSIASINIDSIQY